MFSSFIDNPAGCIKRKPHEFEDTGPVVSVIVEEVVQEGVMGGGDNGVVGDAGHLDLGESRPDMGVSGEATPCCCESVLRLRGLLTEPDRTSCLSAATGDPVNPNRGEFGVVGVGRAGETSGGMTEGS